MNFTSHEGSVEALLNPCHCKDVYSCTCRSQDSASGKSSISPSIFNDGLSALAHVAACCAPASSSTLPAAAPISKTIGQAPAYNRNGTKIAFDLPSQTSSSSRLSSHIEAPDHISNRSILKINQPIIASKPSCCSSGSTSSDTGGTCGCGQQCACAGCATHDSEDMSVDSFVIRSPTDQGPFSVRPNHKANCGSDCPTCVDYDGGAELPGTRQTPTFIDQFLQRAATLPPPPPTLRARGTSLDPTNVIVYPPSLFTSADRDERSRAFGLVNIPKLECCGGRCSCPENQCGCGENCGGCCIDDEYPAPAKDTQQISPPVSSARGPATNLATSSSVNLS